MIARLKTLSIVHILKVRLIIALALSTLGASLGWLSFASTPSSGTLSDGTPVLTYEAGPFPVANPSPLGLGQVDTGPRCGNGFFCDSYALTVSLPGGYAAAHPNASVRVTLSWTDTGTGNSDYDLYVYNGTVDTLDGNTPAPYQGDGGTNPEVASIFPVADGQSTFSIKIVPFTPTAEVVQVRIELLAGTGGPSGFPNFGGPDPTVAGVPRYQTFYPPPGSSAEPGSGEFNIGYNPATGRMMLNNAGPVWRLTPPEVLGKPECCAGLWEDRSSTIANKGLDPILWTDQVTGRTFASNFTAGANALYAYTDTDGEPTVASPTGWTVLNAAVPNGGADHQTIGTGPYPDPLPLEVIINPVTNPHARAVYYCSQSVVGPAACQRSDDMGVTYGPGVLAYDGAPGCSGLHGHLRVAPDGTAYLPVPDCSSATTSQNGVVVSTDGGMTWVEKYIPNSVGASRGSDSAIAIDANNKLYYFYILETANGNEGHMYVQISTNRGDTWSNPVDLGASHGVVNVAFPESIAGDSGRAAVGFLGTDQPGNFQSLAFPGIWYAFMATTFDGGNTWTTVNVSPNDPVQGAGGIWQGGGGNDNRNLLDFNEITIDNKGRPLFGYSDGCVGDCVVNSSVNSFVAHMRVARQTGGRTLFASQDAFVDNPGAPIVPKAPCLSATRDLTTSHLTWKAPDNGGSPIVSYEIWRGTASGNEIKIATTGTDKASYNDITVSPSVPVYYYYVKAINGVGTGPQSNEISVGVVLPPACVQPTGPFSDDFEPGALPGWQVDTANNEGGPASPTWQVINDPGAHSPTHSFFSDSSTVQPKDDRLIAPPQNISPTTRLTFWHRYQFEDGYDGGVLEVSTDNGATWVDVLAGGGSFVSGGYNGTIDPGFGNVIAGRKAWTGGDATAAMTKVEVNLGAFAGYNVLVRFRLGCDFLQTPGVGWFIDDVEFTNLQSCPPLQLSSVVSRKTHGTTNFDIDMPLVGTRGIECRSGGANSAYQLVFTFPFPMTACGNASVGTASNGPNSNQCTVNLTGVPNGQYTTVTLSGAVDTAGRTGNVTGTMGLLVGDVNSSGAVDSGDVLLIQKQNGQALPTAGSADFRRDLNLNGSIDSGDVLISQKRNPSQLQ